MTSVALSLPLKGCDFPLDISRFEANGVVRCVPNDGLSDNLAFQQAMDAAGMAGVVRLIQGQMVNEAGEREDVLWSVFPVVWSEQEGAERHLEWVMVKGAGRIGGEPYLDNGKYYNGMVGKFGQTPITAGEYLVFRSAEAVRKLKGAVRLFMDERDTLRRAGDLESCPSLDEIHAYIDSMLVGLDRWDITHDIAVFTLGATWEENEFSFEGVRLTMPDGSTLFVDRAGCHSPVSRLGNPQKPSGECFVGRAN